MEVDGALADPGGPRQRPVLLRLLVGQGSSVSVDRLLTDLYDCAPPPSALSGLQAYVSHLRRTLDPHQAQRTAPTVLSPRRPAPLRLPAGAPDADAFAADPSFRPRSS